MQTSFFKFTSPMIQNSLKRNKYGLAAINQQMPLCDGQLLDLGSEDWRLYSVID